MEQGPFQHEKWESEKHKSWGMPAEGFKGHVAVDGSLLGNAGEWGVVVQWYSWTTMKRWDHCMACMAQWRQNPRFCALSGWRS